MSLVLPGTNRITNLHLSPDQINWQIDGDTRDWLAHLPEEVDGGEKLYVLIHKDHPKPFTIMEKDVWDAEANAYVDMFVLRTDHLGSDTYRRLARAKKIPLLQRLEWAEKENAEFERQAHEEELDRLYYTLGEPMEYEMRRNGFTRSGVGSKSYPIVSRQKQRYKSQANKPSAISSNKVVLPSGVRSI